MEAQHLIRCNKCDWHGNESDLLRCDDASDGERADACPTCRTDHYLMDLADSDPADEKPFTIPEISIGMDESEYIKAVDLIGTAATLAGDGECGELGRNAEYERGMAELIARFMNWSGDRVPEVIAAIHGTAKDANRAR